MSVDAPPITRLEFATHVEDEAAAAVQRMFLQHRSSMRRGRRDAEFRVATASAGEMAADRVRTSIDFVTKADPLDHFICVRAVDGRARYRIGDEDVWIGQGGVCLIRPGVPFHGETVGADLALLRLPTASVAALAADMTGVAAKSVRFESLAPVSPAMDRYWRGLFGWANREILAPDTSVGQPLVAAEMMRTLAGGLISVFPNSTMTVAHTPGTGKVPPAVVRRAVAYIDTHADQVITLADIASAAGVGARALQYAFARHRAVSPIAYLHRVRLERAHRDLQEADPTNGATVAAIAARWGFAKPGRFSTKYREAYGRSPSQTLRA
ncbi:AraC family transcriptional regulator [Actinokineospora enzanensis]|uniref:AraC family transcriptional regulator n=1 Tax=Actinokineospora enzanensis TaxID=155975 RepID=UPI000375882C|nr:AraC family transcriptional regulator [Actinokineospora enzanensis]